MIQDVWLEVVINGSLEELDVEELFVWFFPAEKKGGDGEHPSWGQVGGVDSPLSHAMTSALGYQLDGGLSSPGQLRIQMPCCQHCQHHEPSPLGPSGPKKPGGEQFLIQPWLKGGWRWFNAGSCWFMMLPNDYYWSILGNDDPCDA